MFPTRESLLFLGVSICAIAGCESQSADDLRPKTTAELTLNNDAYVAWIPIERASNDAKTALDKKDADDLFKTIEEFIQKEFGGGTLSEVQIRYRDYSQSAADNEQVTPDENFNGTGLISGKKAGILRGIRDDSGVVVHQLPDKSSWTEWASIPSTMRGSFIAVPADKVDAWSKMIQGWFASHYGKDFMANEGQFLVKQNERTIIILGVCKWSPPARHLHSIIVS